MVAPRLFALALAGAGLLVSLLPGDAEACRRRCNRWAYTSCCYSYSYCGYSNGCCYTACYTPCATTCWTPCVTTYCTPCVSGCWRVSNGCVSGCQPATVIQQAPPVPHETKMPTPGDAAAASPSDRPLEPADQPPR